MNTLLKYWPILGVIFASGGAFAWQEVQRQTLEQVVVVQHIRAAVIQENSKALVRLQTQQESAAKSQEDIKKKLDLLIELQLKRNSQ